MPDAIGTNVVHEAAALLNALDSDQRDKDIAPALNAFVIYLTGLASKHCKSWSGDYVADVCFRRDIDFSSDTEFTQFARVSLALATTQLTKALQEINEGHADGRCQRLRSVLRDYVFDLKLYIEWLERKKNVTLFTGGKSYRIESFQLFVLARQLNYGSGDLGDHKASQAAGIFVLRQALETRFLRAVGVDLRDKYGQTPKTRHGFHVDFIESNPQHFNLVGCSLSQIKHVYRWANDIVHGAYQPLAWQVAHAMDTCAPIFAPGKYRNGQGFSVHGAVQISQIEQMRQAFLAYFAASYDHGIWSATFLDPDAGSA